jgi:hypothetical protein
MPGLLKHSTAIALAVCVALAFVSPVVSVPDTALRAWRKARMVLLSISRAARAAMAAVLIVLPVSTDHSAGIHSPQQLNDLLCCRRC